MNWIRSVACFGGLVAGLLVNGCGGKPARVADPDKAAAILSDALAAWRDGSSCDELRKRTPPVHVADEHWLRGMKLERFTIGTGAPFGPSTQFEVTLEGPAPLGKKQVVYTVSTQPAISVVLGD